MGSHVSNVRQMFDWIQVKALARPLKATLTVVPKPLLCSPSLLCTWGHPSYGVAQRLGLEPCEQKAHARFIIFAMVYPSSAYARLISAYVNILNHLL